MTRKTAFITGAASGIGRATARRFAHEGWFIGAADINAIGLHDLRNELDPGCCETYQLDVTDKVSFDAAVSAFGERTDGQLDMLFNNAGICRAGMFEHVPYEESIRQVNVNLIGVLNGVYAAMPLLQKTPGSLCMTTSSVAATYGSPHMAAYAATKFAVKGLTEALAVEMARFDSRAADVLPGLVDTAIQDIIPYYYDGVVINEGTRIISDPPKEGPGRLIPAEDVAEQVWNAYHGTGVHYYAPVELQEIDKHKHDDIEHQRDARIKALLEQLGAAGVAT